MKTTEFNKIVNQRIKKIKATLCHKAKEYALNGDRLHNFKLASRICGNTPAQALKGMWMKHIVSVFDLIEGRLEATPEMVDEKCGDMINYLILLESIFKEKQGGEW